jgi:hypothetical protein
MDRSPLLFPPRRLPLDTDPAYNAGSAAVLPVPPRRTCVSRCFVGVRLAHRESLSPTDPGPQVTAEEPLTEERRHGATYHRLRVADPENPETSLEGSVGRRIACARLACDSKGTT